MSDSTAARPRQVTTAAGLVVGGSLFLLVSVFDSVARLQSVQTREQVTEALSSPAGEGLGLGIGQALELMRIGLLVAAVAAAVTLVAGVFVLQRHRGARIALSVAAVPLLLTAPLTGGLLGALVAAAAAVTWSGPARDWYAGRPVRESSWGLAPRAASPRDVGPTRDGGTPTPGAAPHETGQTGQTGPAGPTGPDRGDAPAAVATLPEVAPDGSTGSPSQPPATQGFGVPRAEQAPPAWLPQAPGEPDRSGGAARRVPAPVGIACLVTWVFSGLVATLYSVVTVVLLVSPDAVLDPLRDSPQWEQALADAQVSADAVDALLLPTMVVVLVLSVVWALGACVLALLVRRGHNWARWTLVVSAAATFLLAIAAFPVGLVVQLAAAVVIGLLLQTGTREWFARGGGRGPSRPDAAAPPGPQQPRPPRPGPW